MFKTTNSWSTKPIHEKLIHVLSANIYNHASTIANDNHHIYIAWYSGHGECAKDVKIYFARGTKKDAKLTFTKTEAIATKEITENYEHRAIHATGNPVLFYNQKKLWLFFVTTAGGWSTSSLNEMYSTDNGMSWSKPKMIISSSLFNFSTLLRNAPIKLQQQKFAIPVYNELLDTSGEYAVFNTQGNLIDLRRMSWNGFTLQPSIVPISKNQAWAFFRCLHKNTPQRIFVSHTNNGGKTWSTSTPTSLPNPNSAVFAIKAKNQIRIIYNNDTKSRCNLTIATNSLPFIKNWQNLHKFKNSSKVKEGYPYAAQYKGNLYVTVTKNHCKGIKLYKFF